MNFLYPGFLFALISVAIPVIIHLFNFRKFKKVYFSNVQLLKEVDHQELAQNKIKDLLILICRILAVIFLVLAFAQPYLPAKNQTNIAQSSVVSIYIDNSYSMGTLNADGELIDEAKRKAKEVVASFEPNDRFQLLTNDFEGKHQRLLSSVEFLSTLEEVKISSATKNIQQIVDRQQAVFESNSNKFSVLISDFQKNMLHAEEIKSKPEINYSFVKIKAPFVSNVSIDSIYSLSPSHQAGVEEKLVVKLKNHGTSEVENVPIKLKINEQQKAVSSLSLQAGESKTDTITISGLNKGWQKGHVSITDYPLNFDDSLYFSFNIKDQVKVLSINGTKAIPHLKMLYETDGYFKHEIQDENQLNYNAFSGASLIILNELDDYATGLAQQLTTHLTNGGNITIFPNLEVDINKYNTFLSALNLPQVQRLENEKSTVERIELKHPIFNAVFDEAPKNMDLPYANKHMLYHEEQKFSKVNLMQFPGNKMFFGSFAVGEGQVFLSAVGLQPEYGNFAKHPIFLPLMFQMVTNKLHSEALYYTIGDNNTLQMPKILMAKNQVLKINYNQLEIIPEVRQLQGKTQLYLADQIRLSGFYNVSLANSLLGVYSFNASSLESEMKYLTDAEMQKLVNGKNAKFIDAEQDQVKLISANHKIGQTLWKLCLILCLIFIAIEIILIRYYKNLFKPYEPIN